MYSQDELAGAAIEEMLMTSDECRLCQCVVPFADVNAHMTAIHRTNGYLNEEEDDDDDEDDDEENDDVEHRRQRHPQHLANSFQCAFCDHVAADADDVDAHVQEKHAPSEPSFFCELCAVGFHTDVGLEAHRRSEHVHNYK